MRLPDFLIIGAMKCGTSTLHEQLAASDAFFMPEPKEPCFFSDEPVYQRGLAWYASLFEAARPDQIVGEASTHYTKQPTHPDAPARLAATLPEARLIYVMRDPIERLISHYIHEWSQRVVRCGINDAIDRMPALVDYSCYAYQLQPYLERFGPERVLPVSFERMKTSPRTVLNEISQFVGGPVDDWPAQTTTHNASNQRLRKSRLRDALVDAPGLRQVRRTLVPRIWRERAKRLWTMNERPELTKANRLRLREGLDADLATLGRWLDITLTCETFVTATSRAPLQWADDTPRPDATRMTATHE